MGMYLVMPEDPFLIRTETEKSMVYEVEPEATPEPFVSSLKISASEGPSGSEYTATLAFSIGVFVVSTTVIVIVTDCLEKTY